MKYELDVEQGIVTRLDSIIWYIKENNLDTTERDIYEFGVCTGNSTQSFLYHFNKFDVKYNKYYGLDSFAGLPQEKEGMRCPDNWKEGEFSSMRFTGLPTPQAVVDHLYDRLKDYNKLDLIPGFYEDVLTDEFMNKKQLKPALFVSMDVDLYISCIQVLDFMFKNKLIVKGTIIRYDDWLAAGEDVGESLAHKEMCEKYHIEFKRLDINDTVIIVYK